MIRPIDVQVALDLYWQLLKEYNETELISVCDRGVQVTTEGLLELADPECWNVTANDTAGYWTATTRIEEGVRFYAVLDREEYTEYIEGVL